MGLYLIHQAICGGLAAAGFGVLFNIRLQGLPWCAASGALALTLRTAALEGGWGVEAASFVAALALGVAVQLLPSGVAVSRNALHVAGCIPMIPGGFAAKAILGLFALTAQHPLAAPETVTTAMASTLHTIFIMGALATGVVIPVLLLPTRSLE